MRAAFLIRNVASKRAVRRKVPAQLAPSRHAASAIVAHSLIHSAVRLPVEPLRDPALPARRKAAACRTARAKRSIRNAVRRRVVHRKAPVRHARARPAASVTAHASSAILSAVRQRVEPRKDLTRPAPSRHAVCLMAAAVKCLIRNAAWLKAEPCILSVQPAAKPRKPAVHLRAAQTLIRFAAQPAVVRPVVRERSARRQPIAACPMANAS